MASNRTRDAGTGPDPKRGRITGNAATFFVSGLCSSAFRPGPGLYHRHLRQQTFVDWEPTDLVQVSKVSEFVDVGLLPGLGAHGTPTPHVTFDRSLDDVFGDNSSEAHRTPGSLDLHQVAGLNSPALGIDRVHLHQGLRMILGKPRDIVMLGSEIALTSSP